MIYQLHNEHGKHIAYSATDAEINIKNGWRTVTEQEFNGKQKEVSAQTESIEMQYEKRFGKKPHHRCSKETIISALNHGEVAP